MEGQVNSSSGKSISTHFAVRELSPSERRKKALQGLGLFWGLSLITLPLPPIHWVTVPGFFLFGIYWAWKKLHESSYFEPFSFPCPECTKEVEVASEAAKLPLELVCPHCRFLLRLHS